MRLNLSFEVKPHRVSRVCVSANRSCRRLLPAENSTYYLSLEFEIVKFNRWSLRNSAVTIVYLQGKQMERGRVESAPKSPSCVWNSPIRLPRSGKLPSSHIARLAVWRHVFRSPSCVLRSPCCVLNQSRISGSCASTIARKPLSQGSCLDGLNTALRRRRDILVIDRASGQLTRFDSATLLCDALRLRNHDAERRATKKPFPFVTDYLGLGVCQLASLLGLLFPIWPDADGILFSRLGAVGDGKFWTFCCPFTGP